MSYFFKIAQKDPVPETYLVRVPRNDRRYVNTNHLILDDARGMNAHKEIVTPEMVKHNPPLDIQREPVVPETRLQIQSEVDIAKWLLVQDG